MFFSVNKYASSALSPICGFSVVSAHLDFVWRVGMMMKFSSLTFVAILQGCVDARTPSQRDASAVNSTFNVLDYVDPLIGTANGGLLMLNVYSIRRILRLVYRSRLCGCFVAIRWVHSLSIVIALLTFDRHGKGSCRLFGGQSGWFRLR